MWEPREPTRQETVAGLPDAPRHRSRKDRKRWCGGHVDREHVRVIRLSKTGQWQLARGAKVCEWRRGYRWARVGEKIPADAQPRRNGRYLIPTKWRWSCTHEIGCSRCGKVLDGWMGVDRACPDYHERTGSGSTASE